jgi:hypothetical protein
MRRIAVTLSIALAMGLSASVIDGCSAGGTQPSGEGRARTSTATPAAVSMAPSSPTPGSSQRATDTSSAASFWRGTDSWPVPVTGKGPYYEPAIGGSYGGYIGMAGNWARQLGCHTGNFLAWSAANSAQAAADYTAYHQGVGVGVYWYMGGPGVDPHYDGSASEASAWGARQAAWALAAAAADHVTYPVLWADIELPGIAPAPDAGWTSVYTGPCTGVVRRKGMSPSVSRAEFDGFAAYVASHSSYKIGVYSSPGIWPSIFGTGKASLIPGVYEWTYEPETASLANPPSGWCLKGTSTCARFFGGQTSSSKYALAWQWSGGGGVRNPYGDFDQMISLPPAG